MSRTYTPPETDVEIKKIIVVSWADEMLTTIGMWVNWNCLKTLKPVEHFRAKLKI